MSLRTRLSRVEGKLFPFGGCPACAGNSPLIQLIRGEDEATHPFPTTCSRCGRNPNGVHTLIAMKPANVRD
jgi:hypothetical protein